ncbi:helix-turn-helix transcriptional regulator, partial [Streptomyces fimicarius]|uniref:helix-turn-helix transcriptional regulator n=1 Tax=Streptomyces griseus TaxID=1911 RepID=UPI0036AFAAE6
MLAVEHTKIRALREQAGLTPQELADRVGVTYRVVAYWEEGRYVPEAKNVRRLADALGCATADLTGTPRACPADHWLSGRTVRESGRGGFGCALSTGGE